MTGIFVSHPPNGRPRCARCGKHFTPKKEGDRLGPQCARKQQTNHIEIKDLNNKTLAVII